ARSFERRGQPPVPARPRPSLALYSARGGVRGNARGGPIRGVKRHGFTRVEKGGIEGDFAAPPHSRDPGGHTAPARERGGCLQATARFRGGRGTRNRLSCVDAVRGRGSRDPPSLRGRPGG